MRKIMKKMVALSVTSIALVALAACGNNGDNNEVVLDESTPIEVELIVPDSANAGEEVVFESIVTQGEDDVEDATEVIYEIWLEGDKENSAMIEADSQEKNNYKLTHTFEEDGLYNVQTHVTARGLHRMPTAQIVVGDVDEHAHHEDGEEGHGHHEHGNADVHAMVNEDKTVTLHVEVNGEAFVNGEVTLEMWKDGEEKHEWLDAVESGNGEYIVADTSQLDGEYKVVVHITDPDVHEHVETTLQF